VTFNEWNLAAQTSDATFKPKLPADYEGIAILQRAAAVKHTATPTRITNTRFQVCVLDEASIATFEPQDMPTVVTLFWGS